MKGNGGGIGRDVGGRSKRRVRYQSVDLKDDESSNTVWESGPQSLKESTLGGLIVSHKEWQSQRFNSLLNEEIRISNKAFSQQALLYDPIVSEMAFNLCVQVESMSLGGDQLDDVAGSLCRIFQHLVVRRAHAITDSQMQRWLDAMERFLQRSTVTARFLLKELVTGQPQFRREQDQLRHDREMEQITGQLDRLQTFSKALGQVGKPLVLVRGIREQILECDCPKALHAMLELFKRVIITVVENKDRTEEDIALIQGVFQALLAELPFVSKHTALIEIYTEAWACFCTIQQKPIPALLTKLEVSAMLVHLLLGSESPGGKIDSSGKLLPPLGVAEGVALPNHGPLAAALSSLLRAPILGPLSTKMLCADETRDKILELCILQPSKTDFQDLLVEMSRHGFVQVEPALSMLVSTLAENVGFTQYQHSTTRASKAILSRDMIERIALAQTSEDGLGAILSFLTKACIEEFRKGSITQVTSDAEYIELAEAFAQRVNEKLSRFGVPQLLVNLLGCFCSIIQASGQLAHAWLDEPENKPRWLALVRWYERVFRGFNTNYTMQGFSESFLGNLKKNLDALREEYAPEPIRVDVAADSI